MQLVAVAKLKVLSLSARFHCVCRRRGHRRGALQRAHHGREVEKRSQGGECEKERQGRAEKTLSAWFAELGCIDLMHISDFPVP